MKKKAIAIFTVLVTLLFTINVKASEPWEIHSTIQKGEDSRILYNLMPTDVEKGDIITVKLLAENVQDWHINFGQSMISWDKEAFEIVEVDGKYYKVLNSNITNVELDFSPNSIFISYSWNDEVVEENNPYLIELTFKVKKSVKDGIYNISQSWYESGLNIYEYDGDNYDYQWAQALGTILKYQVGKTKVTSDYNSNSDAIGKGSYVIGNYLFTRTPSDNYSGYLTTKYIMLASKTIEGDSEDDMVIYYKNTSGNWVDGLTYEEIETPEKFKINYIDLKARYQENGIYSNGDNSIILEYVQINENEALILIEADKESIRGIATLENGVATLVVDNKSYAITITDNGATIQTNDSNITNTNLEKRANYSVDDYYNENYRYIINENSNPVYYLKSEQTGKYVFGDYELDFVRVDDNIARVCIKFNNEDKCVYDEYAMGDTNYEFSIDEDEYTASVGSNSIELTCNGSCTPSFGGVYTKVSSLSMDDVFHIWEQNQIRYRVDFDMDSEDGFNEMYVPAGNSISNSWDWQIYYNQHDKDGYVFVEWQLNGQAYDFDSPVTGPITLVATYRKIPAAPILSVPQVDGHDYQSYEDGQFLYNILLNTTDSFDGYSIFNKENPDVPITTDLTDTTISMTVASNEIKTYFVKTYITVGEDKYYSEPSNEITLNPRVYEVTFNSNGGSSVESQTVPYNGKVMMPSNPTKDGRVFVEWQLNGVKYNFNNPVTGAITLDAVWGLDVPTPTISVAETGSYYVRGLVIDNLDDYCTTQECNSYVVEEYEVYLKNGEVYTPLAMVNIRTTYSINQSPNEIANYAVRLYLTDGTTRVYSNYSEAVQVDTTYVAPTLSYTDMGASGNGTEQYNFTIDSSVYEYGAGYKVSGFDVFKVVNVDGELNGVPVGSSNTVDGVVTIYANPDVVEKYVARVFAYDSESRKVYSTETSNLVTTLLTPVIARNESASCSDEACNVLMELTNLSSYAHMTSPGPENPYIITKLEYYEVNGDNKELIKTVTSDFSGTQLTLEMNIIDDKDIVAKVYALDENNEEVGSQFSNVIHFTKLSLLPNKDSISLSCDNTTNISPGDTVDCYITPIPTNGDEIVKYGYNLYSDSSLQLQPGSIVNGENVASYFTYDDASISVTLTNPASETGEESRIKYSFNVNANSTLSINKIWFMTSDGKLYSYNTKSVSLQTN